MEITSNMLFVSWFGLIIILDKVGGMFDVTIYKMDIILLIMSGIFLYAIYRTNMKSMRNTKKYKSEEG